MTDSKFQLMSNKERKFIHIENQEVFEKHIGVKLGLGDYVCLESDGKTVFNKPSPNTRWLNYENIIGFVSFDNEVDNKNLKKINVVICRK